MKNSAIRWLATAIAVLFATEPTAYATTYFRQTTNYIQLDFGAPLTILSVSVPAGNWVIESKAVTSGNYFSLTCSLLVNGAMVDQSISGLNYMAESEGQTVTDLAAVTVSRKSTIALSCNINAGSVATINSFADLLVRPAEKFK
jgi:hypothetical protein